MSGLIKIVLTSAFTVLGGVVVFVLGQVATKFFLEPIHEQSRAISEIIDSLIFYANLYANPDKRIPASAPIEIERHKASNTLRRHASQLSSKTNMIPWYGLWEFIKIVPKRSCVTEACKGLVGLSNNLFSGTPEDAREYRTQITKALNLPFI